MSYEFRLRFPVSQIRDLASRYEYVVSDRSLEESIPEVKQRGHLTKADLLHLAKWKSPRSAGRAKNNPNGFVEEVTRFCLATPNERARIQALTTLDGVGWPTASCILHFFHKSPYPILDFRALEALSAEVPSQYTFSFWNDYVKACRDLSEENGVDMRTLDRALWQFSKENGG